MGPLEIKPALKEAGGPLADEYIQLVEHDAVWIEPHCYQQIAFNFQGFKDTHRVKTQLGSTRLMLRLVWHWRNGQWECARKIECTVLQQISISDAILWKCH